MFIHLVWFAGRQEPERIRLPDRHLYDEFVRWLQNPEATKGGWCYEHDNREALTVINFRMVACMTVREQPASRTEAPSASAERSLADPVLEVPGAA